jgi:hypothetical protein
VILFVIPTNIIGPSGRHSKVIEYSKLLGLERKPPPQKTLDEILNESEPEQEEASK